jgi:hypothetical protein
MGLNDTSTLVLDITLCGPELSSSGESPARGISKYTVPIFKSAQE